MKKVVSTANFWAISVEQAWEILRNIEHTYCECSSVCDLATNYGRAFPGHPYEMGVIDMGDLGLSGDNITYKEVVKESIEKGYSKITFSDIINYIKNLDNRNFDSQTAIMSIMDKVVDGDGISGVVYLQPDEDGWLRKVGFLELEESRPLSRTAKFLVKKMVE